jgi:hypothetical protein
MVAETDADTASEWLAATPVVERVQLDEQSWVDIVRGILPRADEVFRYEKYIDEPRLGAMHAGSQRHPALVEVEQWITRRYRVRFDNYALALYRNERDSVAWHRDREMKWLEDTVIGVLTLGATRPWLMKPMTGPRGTDDDMAGAIDLVPASGDLLVMGGRAQAAWLHAVPKLNGRVKPRISVQWRHTSRRGRPDTAPSYYAPRHFGSGGGARQSR